jgi:hypothetical protein
MIDSMESMKMNDVRTIYMCKTTFDHDLDPDRKSGVPVYTSLDSLKSAEGCHAECGIVEVEVRIRTVVQEPAGLLSSDPEERRKALQNRFDSIG